MRCQPRTAVPSVLHQAPQTPKQVQGRSAKPCICQLSRLPVSHGGTSSSTSRFRSWIDAVTGNRAPHSPPETCAEFPGKGHPLPWALPVHELSQLVPWHYQSAHLNSCSLRGGLAGGNTADHTRLHITAWPGSSSPFFLVTHVSSSSPIYCEIHGN